MQSALNRLRLRRLDRAVRRANCLRCYFEIVSAIERNAADYERAFGEIPRFRAGLHGGEVVAASSAP